MLRNNLKGLALAVVALTLIGCFPTLTGAPSGDFPGINTPLTVNDVEVQVMSVEVTNDYSSGFRGGVNITAQSPDQEVVVVTAHALSQDDVLKLFDWAVALTVDGGSPVEAATVDITTNVERKGGRLIWVFVVPAKAQTFVLNLPDGQTIDISLRVNRSSDAK